MEYAMDGNSRCSAGFPRGKYRIVTLKLLSIRVPYLPEVSLLSPRVTPKNVFKYSQRSCTPVNAMGMTVIIISGIHTGRKVFLPRPAALMAHLI